MGDDQPDLLKPVAASAVARRTCRHCFGRCRPQNGDASLTTTERYLGVHQDLYDAPCDYIRLDLAAE